MSVIRFDKKAENIYASDSPTNKSKSSILCIKCNSNKILIQSLTQQCWSLQKSFMIKDLQINQLKSQLSKLKQSSDQPFIDITSRILKEKEQRINILQKQLQKLRQNNHLQKNQIEQKNYLLKSIEEQYKSNLLSIRQQMEEIIQISNLKLQQLMKENEQKEEENNFLIQKCLQLQQQFEKTSLSETKKVNNYLQLHKNTGKIDSYIPKQKQLDNCYKPSSKALQKLLLNKFVRQPIKLSQNLQSTRSNKTLPVGDIGFKSEKNLLKNNTIHSMQEQKRREMTFAINLTPNAQQNMFKRQKYHNKDSLESILLKLGDIQNEVRKQINSSKRGYK